MWGSSSKKLSEKLDEAADASLNRLKYEHSIDPLWSELKFGDWLDLRMAFVEERGYSRGWRGGVKAGLARASGFVPALPTRVLLQFWGVALPLAALADAFMLTALIRFFESGNFVGVACLLLLFPPVFVFQAIGSGWLVKIIWRKIMGEPVEDEVFAKVPPVPSVDDDASEHGQKEISDAITNAERSDPKQQ